MLPKEVLSTWFGHLEDWSASVEYLLVNAATKEPTLSQRAWRIVEVVEVASLGTVFPIVVQEAELVRVPTVAQRGVVDGATLSCVVSVYGKSSPSTVVLGLVGAVVAPVIRCAYGGARKVKSVNTLVETLESPAQKRVIVATRSRRGRGRPAKE
ncbi:hypothetical protein V6N12_067021 [Hibiscus sabdariffa]|uniref:Uncharacterized protein n=1 Tax=Hibiscus sabdariffa TaxID=183260 RepID=A0ABR2BKK7_9ROSI